MDRTGSIFICLSVLVASSGCLVPRLTPEALRSPSPWLLGAPSPLQAPKVIGGTPVPDGGAPYIVSLKGDNDNAHFCAAIIISDRWLLTASHCYFGAVDSLAYYVYLYAGSNDLTVGGTRIEVLNIICHPETTVKNNGKDIALLRTIEPIQFSNTILPVALPFSLPVPRSEVLLSGWGRTEEGNSKYKQWLTLKMYPTEDCAAVFQQFNNTNYFVHEDNVCTLTKIGQGSCNGDSGGPLVGLTGLVGIVQFGVPCALGYPDVYTGVFSHKEWIVSTIEGVESGTIDVDAPRICLPVDYPYSGY